MQGFCFKKKIKEKTADVNVSVTSSAHDERLRPLAKGHMNMITLFIEYNLKNII